MIETQIALPFGESSGAPLPAQLLRDTTSQEDERRRLESDAIAQRYEKKLEERGASRTMSPEWIQAQPTSLKAKLRVTPEEEETILFHFASTSSVPQTADLAEVREAKVRAVIYAPEVQDRLAELRNAMRVSVIRKIEETQTILLEALQTPSKLNDATLGQISSVLKDISETQINLLNASRSPDAFFKEVDPTEVFSGDELEYMALLRRRLLSPSGSSGGPAPSAISASGEIEDFLGHDFVDPTYDVSPSAEEVDISGDSVAIDEAMDEQSPGRPRLSTQAKEVLKDVLENIIHENLERTP